LRTATLGVEGSRHQGRRVTTSGFNLNTVGVILMVAGALGLMLSLLFGAAFRRIGGAGPWPAPTR
jgi:hypothetical protein